MLRATGAQSKGGGKKKKWKKKKDNLRLRRPKLHLPRERRTKARTKTSDVPEEKPGILSMFFDVKST